MIVRVIIMSIISMNSITITISLIIFTSISFHFYHFLSIQIYLSAIFHVIGVHGLGCLHHAIPRLTFFASMEECGVVGEQRSTIDHLAPNMSNARPSSPWLIKNWELPNSDHWLLSICWSPMINGLQVFS
jgi:hypothetical protein